MKSLCLIQTLSLFVECLYRKEKEQNLTGVRVYFSARASNKEHND